jgi:phenylalanyl-tRNA synthetase beta chain
MKFSYDWIKELGGLSLESHEAADILTAKSFEVEDVSAEGVMEIKVLPNRPDCLSHLGLARELCALTSAHFTAPAYEYKVGEHPAVSVTVEDTDACPRYSALVVRGVKIGPSPDWLTERLVRCGLKSINNVVDVANYVMLELGQPMHAFDITTLDRIVVRRAKAGEKLKALDEAQTEYALDPSMLVIADGSRAVAIAGIKGGVGTGITDATTDVLLEAANFDPAIIRATSRKLGLRTDASVRFSYGMDPNMTAAALIRAAELLAKVAGGKSNREIIDVYPSPRVAHAVMLDPAYARSLLGAEIGDGQIRNILDSLGFELAEVEPGQMKVTVPTRRLDVTGSEDLIEEVGRVYGYDAIPSIAPALPVYDEKSWVQEDAEAVAWDEYGFIRERGAITHLLAGAGYSEVYNYSFVSEETKYELANPQSPEYRFLRTSLVPRLLVNTRDNLRFTDEVKLFETGHTFDHTLSSRESTRLGLVLAKKTAKNELFYELKGLVDLLLERLGVADYYYDDASPFDWDAGAVNATAVGRQALIRLEGDGHIIGFIGAVSPRAADNLKIKGSVAVAELCLRSLIRHVQREREFEPLPKYPSVVRDIAILVDVGTKIDDILQVIQDAGGDLVDDVDVFDIFLPTGKEKLREEDDKPAYAKSVACHVIYRSDDHTLTDSEVARVEDAIKKALQEKLNAQIR